MQVVVIPASLVPSRTCFDIEIVDDEIVENDEDFLVSFEIPPGTNANEGGINVTRVVIVDNDSKYSTYVHDTLIHYHLLTLFRC